MLEICWTAQWNGTYISIKLLCFMCHAPSHFQFTSWLRWIAWETELCAPNFIPIEQRRQSQFLYSLPSAIAFKQFDALPGFVLKGRTGEAKNEFKKWLPSENRFVPRCQECNCDNILTPHKLRRKKDTIALFMAIDNSWVLCCSSGVTCWIDRSTRRHMFNEYSLG